MSNCKLCGVPILFKRNPKNQIMCLDVDKVKSSTFPDPERVQAYDNQGNLKFLSEIKEGYWLHKITCEARYKKKVEPKSKVSPRLNSRLGEALGE